MTSSNRSRNRSRLSTAVGLAFGAVVHLLFAATVWHLVWFLAGHSPTHPAGVQWNASFLATISIDAALATVFAVPHSLFLLPAVRRRIVGPIIRSELYGCFFCAVTCLALLVTILAWHESDVVLWAAPTWMAPWVSGAFVGSWALLLYGLHLTGLGHQTGFTPRWRWARGLSPRRRAFVTRGLYKAFRHPVYLSFLGLVWFTPVITLDRGVLIAVWTAYIFVGSVLKDRRLEHFIGDPYRRYQAGVPGYPGLRFGLLARIPFTASPLSRSAGNP